MARKVLTMNKLEEVHSLWEMLADYPASESEAALRLLMESLSKWLHSDDIVWVGAARLMRGSGARRDPQKGWRGLAIRHLRIDQSIAERSAQAVKEQDTDPGLTTRALIRDAGRFRVQRLHDGFVDIEAFKQTAHYRVFYEAAGIRDRMFVGIPTNKDTESFFLFDRMSTSKRFSEEDAELIGYVMRGLKWFHRELLLSHGLLLARKPLSGVERKIISLLLTEKTEKEIAKELGQSPATTHKYVTGILRKFGVRGRLGLMALWLGRRA